MLAGGFGGLRRPSDPSVSSLTERERYRCEFARFRSLSHAGESSKESLETEELTSQVGTVYCLSYDGNFEYPYAASVGSANANA